MCSWFSKGFPIFLWFSHGFLMVIGLIYHDLGLRHHRCWKVAWTSPSRPSWPRSRLRMVSALWQGETIKYRGIGSKNMWEDTYIYVYINYRCVCIYIYTYTVYVYTYIYIYMYIHDKWFLMISGIVLILQFERLGDCHNPWTCPIDRPTMAAEAWYEAAGNLT